MHHRKTYKYIIFWQIWVIRSVKTVHTNIFAHNCKLHKFATTNNKLKCILQIIVSCINFQLAILISKPNCYLQKYSHNYAIYIIDWIFLKFEFGE